jgi:hypothetical protein
MGLAPWAGKHRNDLKDWYFPPSSDPKSTGAGVGLGDNFYHKHNFMAGNPFDGTFKVLLLRPLSCPYHCPLPDSHP